MPPSLPGRPGEPHGRSDLPFLATLVGIGGSYAMLIAALLLADLAFLIPDHSTPGAGARAFFSPFAELFASREIRYSIKLSLISCTVTTILSLWFAVPLGYVLSRIEFRGKRWLDALLDIPIVLPPLVIGLSLLILFQTPPGKAIEDVTQHHLGRVVVDGLFPLAFALLGLVLAWRLPANRRPRATWQGALAAAAVGGTAWLILSGSGGRPALAWFVQRHFATPITYAVPGVILAQFTVCAAFAVRAMRVAFDELSPRQEHVALTLGCSRSQAFWLVVLPEARRGVIAAGTLAWARALGEFGPLLVFAGTTRMKTEVLPTTIYLELSVGRLESAVAASLLMVLAAVIVLMVVRGCGLDSAAHK